LVTVGGLEFGRGARGFGVCYQGVITNYNGKAVIGRVSPGGCLPAFLVSAEGGAINNIRKTQAKGGTICRRGRYASKAGKNMKKTKTKPQAELEKEVRDTVSSILNANSTTSVASGRTKGRGRSQLGRRGKRRRHRCRVTLSKTQAPQDTDTSENFQAGTQRRDCTVSLIRLKSPRTYRHT